ncbi:MAG: KpsF/GutQ family sugar-phosphate isomerase [Verrucomicrobiae bacterium]|nr:KpsF/GutQ family sugar-phosphate isomerase [Verrucomicrobiae bacterium]
MLPEGQEHGNIRADMDILARARRVFDVEMDALHAVRRHLLTPSFRQAVEALVSTLNRRGKIVLVGVGKSGNVGAKIAATLTSTGSTCVVLNSTDALHGDLGLVSDGDIILALSYSGETEELIRLLPPLRRFNAKIISLTGNGSSTLARHSDLVLNVRVPKEACPFNLAPTSSTTAMLVAGDALAMCILEARGFTRKDFARFHPSGAIGQSLLVKASDIMRTGKRLARVKSGVPLRVAIAAMMRAKSGSVCIVDARGKLAGIFTDGDLRRHFADPNLLKMRVDDVMTRKPITLREDCLAAEALQIFNTHAIDDLVVVDRLNRPVGLVDSQDLPKLKVV